MVWYPMSDVHSTIVYFDLDFYSRIIWSNGKNRRNAFSHEVEVNPLERLKNVTEGKQLTKPT